jgi:hypothetical protein
MPKQNDYLSALMDCQIVFRYLMKVLGVPKVRQKELDCLIRECAKVLQESRCRKKQNIRIVK